jgi:hypothetical protein
MNKEFIPYEESFALKELGFNEECFWWYGFEKYLRKDRIGTSTNYSYFLESKSCSAPLYSQAFRWFREKYDLDSHISRDYSLREIPKQYCYTINTEEGLEESKNFNTYEEAELECLKKLIEIVKDLAVVK